MEYDMARTDLAVELNESISKKSGSLKGIIVNESTDSDAEVKVTEIKITNKRAAEAIGRPQGSYITIEARNISKAGESYRKKIVDILLDYIRKLLESNIEKQADANTTLLVVGLGNRCITSDSLGPLVVDGLEVDYHIQTGQGRDGGMCAVIPGVMADTGLETADIIRGIAKQVKPSAVIAIDALAARNISRLNTTIQLSDRGINPGSGVGNHRNGLTEENLNVKVIGIGVPTVVDAATIVHDSMAHLLETLDEAEQKEFLEEMISPHLHGMFVTPKDVDETIKYLSFTISEGLNMTFAEIY